MNKALVIALTLTVSAAVSAAAVSYNVTSEAAPLAGYTRYVISASTDTPDAKIIAIELNAQGLVNQVNPGGGATIFTDNNFLFPLLGFNVLNDSQVLFATGELAIADSSESASQLYAGFAFKNGFTNPLANASLDVAQVVLPEGAQADVYLRVIDATAAAQMAPTEFNFVVPEPATMSLLGLGALGLLRRRR